MLFSPSEPSVRKRTCTSGRLTQTYSNADHIQTAPLDEQGLPRTAFYVPHCVGCYLSHTRTCANTPERSVLPASSSIAMAQEPLDRPSRFGLTSTPQAFCVRR